ERPFGGQPVATGSCYQTSTLHQGTNVVNDKLEQRAFILLLVTISALFFFLIKPFFASVFWACAIALVFYPVQQRLIRRWAHRPNLSALATLFICIVVVVIPVLLILTSFVQEAAGLYQRISSGEL